MTEPLVKLTEKIQLNIKKMKKIKAEGKNNDFALKGTDFQVDLLMGY